MPPLPPKRPAPPAIGLAPPPLRPFYRSPGGEATLYAGHVLDVLARTPEKSVHCVVTSPPYWGLRDYGTGTWEGGDPACDHKQVVHRQKLAEAANKWAGGNRNPNRQDNGEVYKEYVRTCGKCGAARLSDQQLGSEPSPDCGTQGKAQCGRCFVCSMVGVFRAVRRVLRDDGTLWLNLGSGYGADGQLVWTPALVALALQADGWVLRSDVPWVKRSPMPESVTNRPVKALEYVFLLAKKPGYYFDMEAVKLKSATAGLPPRKLGPKQALTPFDGKVSHNEEHARARLGRVPARNFRQADLWFQSVAGPHGLTGIGDELVGLDVTSQGFPGAHFATFPPGLVRPMVRAGTSEFGCCGKCGGPYRRVTAETKLTRPRPNDLVKRTGESGTGNSCGNTVAGVAVETLGWEPTCPCWDGAGVIPCTVLDPFVGSGTVTEVAGEEGRHSVGIDLSEAYLRDFAVGRAREGSIRGAERRAVREREERFATAKRRTAEETGLFG